MHEQSVADRLEAILDNVEVIASYFIEIKTPNDFYLGKGGMVYDAILMRLQTLGENIKIIYRQDPALFADIQNEVISIIRFRDIISHHYEKLDANIVYEICRDYLPLFQQKIKAILNPQK